MVNIKSEHIVTLHEDPRIYAIKNFLSHDECKELIDAALERGLQRCFLYPNRIDPGRTSTFSYIKKDWLSKRIEILLSDNDKLYSYEDTQVTRYLPGQESKLHCDYIPIHEPRIITVLIYLNTVNEGGCTFFNKLNLRIKPEEGTVILFFPTNPDGTGNRILEHAAEPAIDEKWVCQIWIQSSPSNLNKIEINSDV